MKIIIIDNYDSFTYNLAHLVRQLGAEVNVVRNDQFQLPDLQPYDKILLSPGPGIPSEAGLLMDVIKTYAGHKPILGVCLGHQAIGEAFGARLENLSDVFHGVATPCHIGANASERLSSDIPTLGGVERLSSDVPTLGGVGSYIFRGLPETITVGRYHSWVVSREDFPECLEITAESDEGQIMALRHRTLDVQGIQFHPESVLTPDGPQIINNWFNS